MMTTEEFLARIERHLVAANKTATGFSVEVRGRGDRNFVADLREGRKPTLDVVNKVLAHIEASETARKAVAA